MRILCLIFCVIQIHFECVGASFRSRLSKHRSQKNIFTTPAMHTKSNQSKQWIQKDPKCMQPCQLEPYWVSFDKVLELSDIPMLMHSVIRSKTDVGHMINVGKCAGNCNASIIPLYQHSVRILP